MPEPVAVRLLVGGAPTAAMVEAANGWKDTLRDYCDAVQCGLPKDIGEALEDMRDSGNVTAALLRQLAAAPTVGREELREELADILRRHQAMADGECTCGWKRDATLPGLGAARSEHVADALLAALAARAA